MTPTAYIQWGTAPEPCRTEQVPVTGEPGRYLVQVDGRWLKVRMTTEDRHYVVTGGERVTVTFGGAL